MESKRGNDQEKRPQPVSTSDDDENKIGLGNIFRDLKDTIIWFLLNPSTELESVDYYNNSTTNHESDDCKSSGASEVVSEGTTSAATTSGKTSSDGGSGRGLEFPDERTVVVWRIVGARETLNLRLISKEWNAAVVEHEVWEWVMNGRCGFAISKLNIYGKPPMPPKQDDSRIGGGEDDEVSPQGRSFWFNAFIKDSQAERLGHFICASNNNCGTSSLTVRSGAVHSEGSPLKLKPVASASCKSRGGLFTSFSAVMSSAADLLNPMKSLYCKAPNPRLVFLGSDHTGKTMCLQDLLKVKSPWKGHNTIPTIGFNTETIIIPTTESGVSKGTGNFDDGEIKVDIWEIGGAPSLRKMWKHYFQNTDAFVFFVNATSEESINCTKETINILRKDPEVRKRGAHRAFLVVVSHCDLHETASQVVEQAPGLAAMGTPTTIGEDRVGEEKEKLLLGSSQRRRVRSLAEVMSRLNPPPTPLLSPEHVDDLSLCIVGAAFRDGQKDLLAGGSHADLARTVMYGGLYWLLRELGIRK